VVFLVISSPTTAGDRTNLSGAMPTPTKLEGE